MHARRDEHERPIEWLRALEETADGFDILVRESGGLSFAAYRLARARCRIRGISAGIPTRLELRSAAVEVAERVGWRDPMPTSEAMAAECEVSGHLVLGGPLHRAA